MKINKNYFLYGAVFLIISSVVFFSGCTETSDTQTSESENIQPRATIESILPEKDRYIFGESIEFTGDGTDINGDIVSWSWRSDIDGELSTQATFTTSSLSIGTHTIYFKVQDNDGNWSREVRETVVIIEDLGETEIPVINFFTAGPEEISLGEPSTLSWSVYGVTSVEMDPSVGDIESSGYTLVYPTETTSYTLTATNDAGSVSSTVYVTIIEEQEPEEGDTTPPSIISAYPTGSNVPINTEIIITFNEAMDQASAQVAFSTDPFTLGPFSWNDARTEMTFYPSSDLEYATLYTITVNTAAEDESGNKLEEANTFTFATEDEPYEVLDLTGEASLDGTIYTHETEATLVKTSQTSITVGDTAGKYKGRGFLSYGFSDIPATAEIKKATVYVYQSDASNTPPVDVVYGAENLGVLLLEHLYYGDTLDSEDYNMAATTIGTISENADEEWKSIDVTSFFISDMEDESRLHSQYRLRFSLNDTDGDWTLDAAFLNSADGIENQTYICIEYTLT